MQQTIFELPIVGAMAFAAVPAKAFLALPNPQGDAHLVNEAAGDAQTVEVPQGAVLFVLGEIGDYWQVQFAAQTVYLQHAKCFVNLPDVLPSVIYNNTNAVASAMRSCGKQIPGITGQQLYAASHFNARLGKQSYIMPVLYHAAKKIAAAHKAALAQGNAIVVYELFRMQQVQQRVVDCLGAFAQQSPEVMHAISAEPWEMDWFIATGVSKHQRGMAMDLGLAAVKQSDTVTLPCGASYTNITAYELYQMPTPIHELGCASASMAYPVTSRDDIAWRSTPLAPNMTQGACLLRGYCTDAGLTPLASEWWHFNDLEAEQLEGTEYFVLPDVEACNAAL